MEVHLEDSKNLRGLFELLASTEEEQSNLMVTSGQALQQTRSKSRNFLFSNSLASASGGRRRNVGVQLRNASWQQKVSTSWSQNSLTRVNTAGYWHLFSDIHSCHSHAFVRKIASSEREAKRHHSVKGGCPQLDVHWLLLGPLVCRSQTF